MHIYLCTILTIRFLEMGPARRSAVPEGRPRCGRAPYRHVNTGFRNEYRTTKEIDAFGLRSLSKLLRFSALVKPEKSLLFLEGTDSACATSCTPYTALPTTD